MVLEVVGLAMWVKAFSSEWLVPHFILKFFQRKEYMYIVLMYKMLIMQIDTSRLNTLFIT